MLALLEASGLPARAVTFDWVTVDDPGNPSDDEVMSCCRESHGMTGFGSVAYTYRIARTELTNAQYAEFLNAVASLADPHELFNTRIREIVRGGSAGSFAYEVETGVEDRPARFIDFFDALRYANWLQNGQPTGLQDETTTEDGAYTLLGTNPLDVVRNEGATFFVPSEDEWYKAAFWDPFEQDYWDFATGFNPQCADTGGDCPPVPEPPPGGADRVSANYCPDLPQTISCPPGWPDTAGPGDTSDAGAYVFSPSPFGTFDQSGNLAELTEGVNVDDDPNDGTFGIETRVMRGGTWNRGVNDISSHSRVPFDPNNQLLGNVTLRVATVPEPGAGRVGILCVVVGLARWRRRAEQRRAASRNSHSTPSEHRAERNHGL
jgi:formylglycine-generating enzyme required for sulfatase activity